MHELSLALEVCRMAEAELGPRSPRLKTVRVELGAEAGIEPANFVFCLEALLGSPPFGAAALALTEAAGADIKLVALEIDDDRSHD